MRLADYPNDAHHAALLVDALATLDRKYSDNIVRIDTATANPARLIGLPGTLKVKGSDRPDRPWRRVTLDGFGTQRPERSRSARPGMRTPPLGTRGGISCNGN